MLELISNVPTNVFLWLFWFQALLCAGIHQADSVVLGPGGGEVMDAEADARVLAGLLQVGDTGLGPAACCYYSCTDIRRTCIDAPGAPDLVHIHSKESGGMLPAIAGVKRNSEAEH